MSEQSELMIRKLRRRIEEFLRTTTPQMLIRIADLCNIKVPDKVRAKYTKTDDSCND